MEYKFKVKESTTVHLKQYETSGSSHFFQSEQDAKQLLQEDVLKMEHLQQKLFADRRQSLLIIFQGMDTAGKDSCIRHIFSGINPQGCTVTSFKQPTEGELSHDFLWRHYAALPAKGYIGIFNRSHYENVLVTRVHPDLLLKENLPAITSPEKADNEFWQHRYNRINDFEKQLTETGTVILKFFLHISRDEQKKRLKQRITDTNKNWKIEPTDLAERKLWDQYQWAYEQMLSYTSMPHAHWHIIPADEKWFSRVVISRLIVHTLEKMQLAFPILSADKQKWIKEALTLLKQE
jgi:PPK2 family polyphosphate:nucleotide phosphotransferase